MADRQCVRCCLTQFMKQSLRASLSLVHTLADFYRRILCAVTLQKSLIVGCFPYSRAESVIRIAISAQFHTGGAISIYEGQQSFHLPKCPHSSHIGNLNLKIQLPPYGNQLLHRAEYIIRVISHMGGHKTAMALAEAGGFHHLIPCHTGYIANTEGHPKATCFQSLFDQP